MNKYHVQHKDIKESKQYGVINYKNCVKEVLEAIFTAQMKAEQKYKYLSENQTKLKKNTIPFTLYCKDCTPFKATGITSFKDSHSNNKQFICFTTFIFKIKELDDNCAVLELLTFKSEKKPLGNTCSKCDKDNACSPSCQVDFEAENDLAKTGIYVNVDLSFFSGISILPAVALY
jgi:Spore coat protein Z